MKHTLAFTAVALALLFTAACGSSGNGIGDIFGGSNSRTYDIRGTVDSVDLSNHSIYLTSVSGYNASLAPGGGISVRVYYDNNTRVEYQGRVYRPEDLERGDQVSVRADQSGNQLIAQTMNVLYDARGGMASSSPNGTYGSNIRGTVRSIDTYRHTMTIDRGYGSTVAVDYSANTPVNYGGRTYSASDLEIGDEVDIRVNDLGSGRFAAQDITVTRNVSGGTYGSPSSSSSVSTIRGTVRYVDAANRTIEIDSPTWVTGFQTNTNTGSRLVLHYDPNTSVDYQGQAYPVTNLERGDVVEVQMQNLGSANYFAQRIVLVRDVNAR